MRDTAADPTPDAPDADAAAVSPPSPDFAIVGSVTSAEEMLQVHQIAAIERWMRFLSQSVKGARGGPGQQD